MCTIFVFGSNTEGRHGKGAALTALQHYGAIYGQPRGRQGNSYAIVTKDLKKGLRSIPLEDIAKQVDEFLDYTILHPNDWFYVTSIGCGLAGYTLAEIAPMFQEAYSLHNVILSKELNSFLKPKTFIS